MEGYLEEFWLTYLLYLTQKMVVAIIVMFAFNKKMSGVIKVEKFNYSLIFDTADFTCVLIAI